MIPELPIAMLACARVGAIHNVVFIGFSAESLRERISGCDASLIITSDYARSGGKELANKAKYGSRSSGMSRDEKGGRSLP